MARLICCAFVVRFAIAGDWAGAIFLLLLALIL